MTEANRGLGTPVIHQCEAMTATNSCDVIHVVLPFGEPCGTPLSDLRDAGYGVVAFNVSPEEIQGCPDSEAYPGHEHLLLRQSNRAGIE